MITFLLAIMLAQSNPVIIDTDAGSDDLLAIAYLLALPDIHIEAITVVRGLAHVHAGALNVLHVLATAGRRDIAVYEGITQTPHEFPAEWRKSADEIFGKNPSPKQPKPDAVNFLKARLQKPCQILALGPLSNIAAALGSTNAVSRIVIMGGAVRVPGNLADGIAEWNMFADPPAAQKVFQSRIPIQLIPLDATNHVPIDAAYVTRFQQQAATPLGKLATQILGTSKPPYAWDPLAAVALTNPESVSYTPLHIQVTNTGRTEETSTVPSNAQVALNADAALFDQIFLNAFVKPKTR
jgi:inosine-uridine nucleoside N-ribohydrolase